MTIQKMLSTKTFHVMTVLLMVGVFQADIIKERTERLEEDKLRSVAMPVTEMFSTLVGNGELRKRISSAKKSILDVAETENFAMEQQETHVEKQGHPESDAIKSTIVTGEREQFGTISKTETILTAGDSMMGEIAFSLRRSSKKLGFSLIDMHKASTGLSNHAYYDWRTELPKAMAKHLPTKVLFLVGTNDAQSIQDEKTGKWLKFGTNEWREEYGKRVFSMAEIVKKNGAELYWVELPPMRSSDFEKKMNAISENIKENAKQGKFHLVNTKMAIGATFLGTSKTVDGKQKQIRAEDGIHLTVSGGELIAETFLAESGFFGKPAANQVVKPEASSPTS